MKGMIYRVVGAPPAAGATRADQLRWIRHFYRLSLAAVAIVVILALLTGSTLLWVVAALTAMFWVCGLASISLHIRKQSAGGM